MNNRKAACCVIPLSVIYDNEMYRLQNVEGNKAVLRHVSGGCNGYTLLDNTCIVVNADDECRAVFEVSNDIYDDVYDFECALNEKSGLSYIVSFDSVNEDRVKEYTARTFGDTISLYNELCDNEGITELKIVESVSRKGFVTKKVLRSLTIE